MRLFLTAAALAIFAIGCTSAPKYKANTRDRVSVMTFNVENLFDTKDDPDKNDEAFLPVSMKRNEIYRNKCLAQNLKYKDSHDQDEDPGSKGIGMQTFRVDECLAKNYDEKIVKRKFERLADVVKQVSNGRGPDILLLQELENIDILTRWRDTSLKGMGYKTLILIEGPDERGIDTALLSRLDQVGEAKLHTIDFRAKEPDISPDDLRPTRGILESHLRLPNGETLAVFTIHFPSQGASTLHRRAAVKTLLDAVKQVPKGTRVIAGGDFNITSTEEWKKKYFRDLISKEMVVSHMVGCTDCPGSTYYKYDDTWSFFDVLLFDKSMLEPSSTWQLDRDSIHLVTSSVYQTDYDGTPAKFRSGRGTVGVSDHWPVYAEIYIPPALNVGVNQ